MSQYTSVATTVCGMSTGLLVSEILKAYGANTSLDYENPEVMRNVFVIWSVMGVACGILAMIPFFFWNLTEEKQLAMARELKIRAYKEEIENGELDPSQIGEAVELGVISAERAAEMGYLGDEAAAAVTSEKE